MEVRITFFNEVEVQVFQCSSLTCSQYFVYLIDSDGVVIQSFDLKKIYLFSVHEV